MIERLQTADPDAMIVMASDAEGNSYSPLEEIDEGMYIPDSGWGGYVVFDKEEYETDEDYEEDVENATSAVILYPRN